MHAVGGTNIVKVSQSNDSPIIDGVLKDYGLTLSLPRFDARELTKIDDVPSKFSGFCDISAGETSEGLTVVIESHRCYAADSQGNASVLKVRVNLHDSAFL